MNTQRAERSVVWLLAGALTVATTGQLVGCAPIDGPGDNANVNDNGDDNDNVNDNVAGLPLVNFSTENFVGSGNCAACHSELTDETGADVSMDTHWRTTMMANATRDPFFLASVTAEVEHAPDLRETIEDVCASCHMPMAHTQAVADGTGTLILNGGFFSDENSLHVPALDGVSCSLCHQIQGTFLIDPEGSFSGNYDIDTQAVAPGRLLFGPYVDPQQPGVMQTSVGYTPVFGEHIGASGLCATCHTLFTPTLDAQGAIVGTFPEQTPFMEWQHSEFGDGVGDDRQCQDCHMPVAEGPAVISRVPSGLEAREPFYQHRFLGGNVQMLRLLRDNVDQLGLTASTAQFADSIARTEDFLQNETADLAIVDARTSGQTLTATLEVTNMTGHKFPTSFPSRRAWILLTVTDPNGTVVFESGTPQTDGSIIGNNAVMDASIFEPHRDVITSADQVQIYEAIMENSAAEVTYTLLRAAAYAKDNRLLPQGFDKATASGDIAVYGQAANDVNFIGGSDQVTYEIDTAGRNGPFTVTAELLYQSLSYRFAVEAREVDAPLSNQFGDLYDAADKTPTVIATALTILP